MKILLIFLLLFLTLQITFGQNSNIRFYNIGVDDGLLHSTVSNITEDTLGFMWFATQDGLNRYDGYDLKSYPSKNNSNSIANDIITELKVDGRNQLWISYVHGGVSRFDPVSEMFHHYKGDSAKTGNLSNSRLSNSINKINSVFFEDSKNNMWIATDDGVNRYIIETDSFEVLQNNILDTNSISNNIITYITEDVEGFIWIGTENGLNRYNPNNRNIVRYGLNANETKLLSNAEISIIKARSDGSIWVGTKQRGLIIIEQPNSNKPTITQLLNKLETTLTDASIFNMYESKIGDIYIGSRNGIYCMTKNNGIYHATLIHKGKGVEYIYHFIEDNDGLIWAASNLDESLMTINTHDKTTKYIPILKNDKRGYGGDRIISFYVNKAGLLWMGCVKVGVYKVNLNTKAFYLIDDNPQKKIHLSNKEIYAIYEDGKRNLYVAVKNALNILNLNNGTVKVIKGAIEHVNNTTYQYSNKLPACRISSIKESPDGGIWLSELDNKISLYNPNENNFINFHNNENDTNSFKTWSPRTICVTKMGDTYFGGTSSGLCKLNSDGLSFSYSPIVETGDNMGTNDKWISIIDEDSDGLLWIGTLTGGLNRYNPKTKTFKHYAHNPTDSTSISGNTINCILNSSQFDKNTIWIGTITGLNKFNKKTQTFKSYTVKSGMPSNTIYGILEDDKGKLWLSTNNGLVKFDPITENITVFTKEDGLQGDVFRGKSYFKNRDGVMYFGGADGLTYFNPKEIRSNTFSPNMVFISFKLFNKQVKINDTINNNVLLRKSISYSNEITLNYNHKIISFEFASLHFISKKKIRYRYMLEGFEDDWNEVDYMHRSAKYTNLPSGDYTLKLEGTNSDDKWSDSTEMRIHIMPPFWETIWFRLIIIALIITIVLLSVKLRTKKLQAAKKQLEDLVNAKTEDLSEVNASLEETQEELSQQNEELIQINSILKDQEEVLVQTNMYLQNSEKELLLKNNKLRERDSKISQQNNELIDYRTHLEDRIKVRTAALEVAKLKAEESDKLKSSFLANMSHEIRTPLNAIVGFSSLFADENITKEEVKTYVNLIQNNSNSLLTIISDIIDISSIQVGQLKIIKALFNIDLILTELKSFYDLNNDKPIDVQFIPDNIDETVQIDNDVNRFRQIMNNLIGNSIKFTTKGFVKFGYNIIDSKIRFFVHDSGPGIALDAQDNIFQYFNKVDVSTGEFNEGTGLGLAISKQLVDQMGGDMWFESEIGAGTKFIFELPYTTSCLLDENLL